MDTLFSSDLARRSHSYHPAAAGTNARSVSTPGPSCTIPSISANISTAPPSTSDISIASNISHVSPGVSGVPPSVSDTISSTPGVLGISVGPGVPEPLPFYPNYGAHMSSSSHTSSNLVMTPSTSPAHLHYPTPFIGSPTGTVTQGEMPEKVAFLHGVDLRPQMFTPQFSLHSSIPSTPSYQPSSHDSRSPSVAGSTQSKKCSLAAVGASPGGQGLTAQAAPENLSLNEGERSSKREKKEQLTPAMLVSVQNTLQYVRSMITSSSVVAAEQRHSERIHSTLAAMRERDPELPDNIKMGMMEAFRKDPSTIDLYLMTPDKSLRWLWIQKYLSDLGFLPTNYELSASCTWWLYHVSWFVFCSTVCMWLEIVSLLFVVSGMEIDSYEFQNRITVGSTK